MMYKLKIISVLSVTILSYIKSQIITLSAGRHKSHTHAYLIDNWCHTGNFLKAQFANCRIRVIDPVSEENQKFFWEWVLEEIIEKLKENS